MAKELTNEYGMVTRKTWEEFRNTGLLLYINQVLHIFGWSIVMEQCEVDNSIVDVYPARVKFRGFDNKSVTKSYKKITTYLKNNIQELSDETNS